MSSVYLWGGTPSFIIQVRSDRGPGILTFSKDFANDSVNETSFMVLWEKMPKKSPDDLKCSTSVAKFSVLPSTNDIQ